jgi:hypothetical protein
MTWKHIAVTWFSLGTIFGSILAFASCSRDTEPPPVQQPLTVHYAGLEHQ